jgi:hypothetical protein
MEALSEDEEEDSKHLLATNKIILESMRPKEVS